MRINKNAVMRLLYQFNTIWLTVLLSIFVPKFYYYDQQRFFIIDFIMNPMTRCDHMVFLSLLISFSNILHKLVMYVNCCFSLSLLHSVCHVKVRFPKTSFLIINYRNFSSFILILRLNVSFSFFPKLSPLLTCFVHFILVILP